MGLVLLRLVFLLVQENLYLLLQVSNGTTIWIQLRLGVWISLGDFYLVPPSTVTASSNSILHHAEWKRELTLRQNKFKRQSEITGLSFPKLGFPGGSVVKNLPAMQEMRVRSLGQKDTLQREMATHSSILAWEIPRTEEPGGLWSK